MSVACQERKRGLIRKHVHVQPNNRLIGAVTKKIQQQVRIQRGGKGVRTPAGKSQDIWVSIGNKQLDPPGKSWTRPPPPPPPWKMFDPLWNLEK